MNIEERILGKIEKASHQGVSLAELQESLPDIARRTLQRWINQLISKNKIIAKGKGKARLYQGVIQKSIDLATSTSIPLSADSKDILQYISQPETQRQPVGYQQDLLDSYQPNKTWYLSGSLRSQLQKMGRTRQINSPAGTYGRDILNRLLIDLSWASSHLEGNTYSLLDTSELIEHGCAAEGKAAFETQMILNHKAAIELLVENIESVSFNRFTLLNLHSALSENLLANPADEGRLRSYMVEIGKSVFHPLSVPAKIEKLFDKFLQKANKIEDPFEQAFFTLVHVPYLQPFADVNKRTSRLAANIPLLRANLCPLTFMGVSQEIYSKAILGVYEMTRVELLRDLFIWAYERSTQEYIAVKQELVEPDPLRLAYRSFIKEIIQKIIRQYDKNALDLIKEEVAMRVNKDEQQAVESLVIEELSRLHQGTLARYGLRLSEFDKWQSKNF